MNTIKPDSAGIIYPYVKNDKRNSEFRIEAELNEPADKELLKKAVADLRDRFPTFFVKLKKQGSMYMLEEAKKGNVVFDETPSFCAPFDFDNEIPFRITVYKNRVAMDVFHVISDGHGATVFFKTLLARYYTLKGETIEQDNEILSLDDAPKTEETQDAFLKIYEGGSKKVSRIGAFAYQYCDDAPHTKLSVTQMIMPSDEVRELAKKYNTTIGVLLVSVYLYAFYRLKNRRSNRKIKVSVPADLRRIFSINTLRNFSLYAIVGISPSKENWSLEKIINVVSTQMNDQITKENLLNMSYTNVTSQNTKLFELLPMAVKKAVLKFGFDYMGERLFTSAFSNVGIVNLPEGLKKHVAGFKLMLGEAMVNQINAVSTTYGGYINLTFSSRVENNDVQRLYAAIIREQGVNIACSVRKSGSMDYEDILL